MIYSSSELKTNLRMLAISVAVQEVQSFLENIQNKLLTSIASLKYVGKYTYTLPRTDDIFIHTLKSNLEAYEIKYEIKKIVDFSGTRDVVVIEWDLTLE